MIKKSVGYIVVLFSLIGMNPSWSSGFEWEVSNRFAPFVTQAVNEESRKILFDKYKLSQGESFEEWHARLSKNLGGRFVSPYLDALSKTQHATRMHWDQENNTHAPEILKFVQHEGDQETTIGIKIWMDRPGVCQLRIAGKGEMPESNCKDGWLESIPLSGASATVTYNGEPYHDFIEPDHIVILALGDSFASGEGNPDYPAQWKSKIQFASHDDFIWLTKQGNLHTPKEGFGNPTKHWVDDNCHRSFFSHQSLLALRMASENTKSFVSFLHYACTGAEIFDGLLAPQYQAWGEGIYIPYSQVNFAIRELCKREVDVTYYSGVSEFELSGITLANFYRRGGKGNKLSSASNLVPGDRFSKVTETIRTDKKTSYPNSGFLSCPTDENGKSNIREPDHVFLSVAGNDFGFADVVKYFLVPSKWKAKRTARAFIYPEVCPTDANRVKENGFHNLTTHCENLDKPVSQGGNGYHAGDIVAPGKPSGIEKRLELLVRILEFRLGVKPSSITMPQYPDQVRKVSFSEPACGPLDTNRYLTKNGSGESELLPNMVFGDLSNVYLSTSAWNGAKTGLPDKLLKLAERGLGITRGQYERWQFNLTEWDAFSALREFEVLRPVLAEAAKDLGINFVCETRDAFLDYGWNMGSKLHLPNSVGDELQAWNPALWDPYVYEIPTRASRTSNDSALTQPGDKQITGTAHPNLTGHRLMAEIIYRHIDAARALE